MPNKCCIFNNANQCDECGECYACDLDSNKKCNSCGKCLDESKDMRSVKIDEIIEEDLEDGLEDEFINSDYNYEAKRIDDEHMEDLEEIEFIDDVDGLNEILEDEIKREEYTYEEFPGLIRIKRKK
ncbi:hypothetical protein [uncultured Clostridium sp.]|uniref:hypothetical protein n=1 Tax=uncultured Clostridium sp. TaxID=59620 RepID=UPI0028E3F250|nr:hypothetical protein [uncultured Clostridium sp.]